MKSALHKLVSGKIDEIKSDSTW